MLKEYQLWYLLGALFVLFMVSAFTAALIVDTIQFLGFRSGQFLAFYIPLMTLAGPLIAWFDLRRFPQE